MNIWLKPLIAFVVGILLGVGVMYLVGIRPWGGVNYEAIPDIGGTSVKALAYLGGNPALQEVTIKVTLTGEVDGKEEDAFLLRQVANQGVWITVNENTAFIDSTASEESQFLSLQDLATGDKLTVFGIVSGESVIAEAVIRQK